MINKYICGCKKYDFSKKDYTYWEERKTTTDEIDVINFIKENFDLTNKYLLHLGIGNSEIATKFAEIKKIVGITISNRELQKAKNLNLNNYESYLCDKYSKNFYELVKNTKFDLIIDTNLKSYSCCQQSFKFFMSNLANILNFNGIIFTSKKGMNWYKKLVPKLSFDIKKFFFFKLKEIEGNKENIFSKKDIDLFIKQYSFTFYTEDEICYFKKENKK
tara:strand:+ start:73 stop:726 length:654 start_codon:yes stop_codon:yes gene_type:complete